MAVVDTITGGRGRGNDNALVLSDTNGNTYRLIADATAGLKVTKNGATGAFGSYLPVTAVTAAAYTVTTAESGTTFTTRGAAGNVNFTLPATPTTGTWFRFFSVAAGTMTITAGTADTMVVFNDATADSIAFSTAAEIIGNGVEVLYDGTGWLTFVHLGAETATPTIAT